MPRWSELDNGGIVLHSFTREGLEKLNKDMTLHKLEYKGWDGLLKLTLKSPTKIKFEK